MIPTGGEFIYPVIMAGGRGERFWPLSRHDNPKQLLNLLGEETMIEQTVNRLLPMVPPEHILILTNVRYRERIAALLPQIPAENIVGEPLARDTAPCVALAAGMVQARAGSDRAVMLMLPADHHIVGAEALRNDLRRAARLAAAGDRLVTLGIKPTFAATDYGYLECGAAGECDGVQYRPVLRYREKPDAATAAKLLESGNCLWNSGMFVWSVAGIRSALRELAPDLEPVYAFAAAHFGCDDFTDSLRPVFEAARKISVDFAVMEKARNIVALTASFDWNDIGNWTAVRDYFERDEHGNAVRGRAALLDAVNCTVFAGGDGHLVAGVGLEDLVVVHTPDVTLICPEGSIGRIRDLLKEVAAEHR